MWGADGIVEYKFGELAELCRRNVGDGGAVEENFEELAELWRRILGGWRSC